MLDAVEDGESFLVVRRGRIVARLGPAAAGAGRAVKDLILEAPVDADWADEIRRTRALTTVERRAWSD